MVEVMIDPVSGEPYAFGSPVQLSDTPTRFEWSPHWARDSMRLVVQVFEEYGEGELMVFDLDVDSGTDCLYSTLPAQPPCVVSETVVTPEWMVFPGEGTWARQREWIAAGRVVYLDEFGVEQRGIFIIDVSNPSAPVVHGPIGWGGFYFNSVAWDPLDQAIVTHLKGFSPPGSKGNKNASPGGLYRIDLNPGVDSSGHLVGIAPSPPELLAEGGSYAPVWRPCHPSCP